MPHQRSAPSPEPIACPICRRPLDRMPHRWFAEFDCEKCGPFSDFTAGGLLAEPRHRPSHVSLRHESPRARSQDQPGQEDETDAGGEGGGA